MNQTERFADRVRSLRTQKGMSKSALARALGVTTTCVWNWEEGNTHPRPEALSRLAGVLSTPVAFLERGVQPQWSPEEATSVRQAPTAPDRTSVNEVVRRAREEIAAAAGLPLDRVKVLLEYGA